MPSIPASDTANDPSRPQDSAQPATADHAATPARAETPDHAEPPEHAETLATFNEAGVRNAQANWLAGINELLYAPNTGYLHQLGAAALGGYAAVQQAMGKLGQQAQDSLADDHQRGIFTQATTPMLAAVQARIQQHAQAQGRVYDADTSRARGLAARDLAVNAWNPAPDADNASYRQCAAILHNELENQFRHTWGDPASADKQTLWEHFLQHGPSGDDGMSSLSTGVVNRLLANGQPHDAQAFLDKVQHTLPAPTRDKLQQFVTAAVDQRAGTSAALEAQAAGNDAADQQRKLDTLRDDGHISTEAHAIATHKLQADQAARSAAQQHNDTQILQKVWALKNANPSAALTDLPSADYAYLKSRGLDANALAILQSHPATDDPGLFNQLHRMATQDPIQFGKANLMAESGKLSRAHMQTLLGLQDAVNKQDSQAIQAGKRIEMTVSALMGDTQPAGPQPAVAEAGSATAGSDGHEKEHHAQALESGLRDHLIAAQQSDPKLTLDDLYGTGASFLKDWSLYGDGYGARRDAQQANNGYLLSPEVLQKASAANASPAGKPDQQTREQNEGASGKPTPAPENYALSGRDSRDSLPADAPVAAVTTDQQQKKDGLATSALPPKFAVGQQLRHGVIGEGSDPGTQVYTVKARGKGKTITLDTFCEETGYNYDQVMALNNLTSEQALKIHNGTAIKLPTTSGAVPSANHKPVIDVDKAASALDKNIAFDRKGKPKDETKGVGYCSHYVFEAIKAGLPKGKHIDGPGYAKDAGPILLKAGYTKVLSSSDQIGTYTPRKGDVVVLQDYPHQGYYRKDKDGNYLYLRNEDGSLKLDKAGKPQKIWHDSPAGHIAMYDGKYWVSDFEQSGTHRIWAGTPFEQNKVGMAIYRP